jgi:hypothetical protein
MKWVLALVVALHGLVHLMGFAKAFGFADVAALQQYIARPIGVLWLLAAVTLIASAVLVFASPSLWWIAAGLGVLLSQALIVTSWADARVGTIANLIILVPVVASLLAHGPGGFRSIYRREVEPGLRRFTPLSLVSDSDLAHLPPPVQKYLRYVGVVGKSQVVSFRAKFTGSIRRNADSRWMTFTADQTNFYDEPFRAFLIESSMFGIPFDGLHLYVGPAATMRVKLASLFTVVEAKGPEMNRAETVTMFNDMCIIAPATLIQPGIRWEARSPLSVRASFTNAGNTIEATLTFNEEGQLVNFESDDRFQSTDGKSFRRLPWSTPIGKYRTFDGFRISSRGEAFWHPPEGRFSYGRFELVSLGYNRATF